MGCLRLARVCCWVATHLFLIGSAAAINLTLDYTYDTSNFFGVGNPSGATAGAQAKASLESAADFYSDILSDSFSAIQTPAPFYSDVSTGLVTWSWSMSFNHPSTGANFSLVDPTIATDECRVFVGSRNLSGSTLGVGGPGGFSWSSTPTGQFSQEEVDQIEQITDDFSAAVEDRMETSGFAPWGGVLSFDNLGTNWHYDHTTLPSAGEIDLLSVAIHELGHVVGLGTADEWSNLVQGQLFTGSAATLEYGDSVPLDCDGSCGHWDTNTQSVILGTSTPQDVLLDPAIGLAERKRLTALDAAGLTDIGWSVITPTLSPADFDGDQDVDGMDLALLEDAFGLSGNVDADGDADADGADFFVWQSEYAPAIHLAATAVVPEPSSATVILIVLMGLPAIYHRYICLRGRVGE
ncbi:MAG: hypothetical protein MK171_10860 [Pirellulales bacterium]|nr:hypothetical protein [Pirellulales bacterium]